MFDGLLSALEDMVQGLADLFASVADSIASALQQLVTVSQKTECDSCHGDVIKRRRGVICQECGASFKSAGRLK